MKQIQAADLFAGAGGTSSGLLAAAKNLGLAVDLIGINHWSVAIATHSSNHPDARHLCANLENVDPRKVVPGGRLNLLVASPECVHHSRARGGKPMSDQSRSSAWHILRWAEALYIDSLLVENVTDWLSWGPLGANGRPLKSKRGELFEQFLRSLRALGYQVDYRILNAADYGDATSRKRLFVQARRGGRSIRWPEPTHAPRGDQLRLFDAKPYRAAREIIDWSVPSQSIYSRKRPLAPNTMRRIMAGLRKFCGLPFVIGQQSCAAPRGVDDPIPTIATAGAISLVEPFIVVFRNSQTAHSIDEPLATMTTSGANFGLCQPYIVPTNHGDDLRSHSIDSPMPTITTVDAWGLIQPFLIGTGGPCGAGRPQSVDQPLGTVRAEDHRALVSPFLVPFYTERPGQAPRVLSVDEPLDTITTEPRFGLAQPFLVSYYGNGGAQSVNAPLHTVTARDRFGLVTPELVPGEPVGWLDIHFRMLQPHELAAAMSFPASYEFTGNREERVRQIGNAVCVRLAEALTGAILQDYVPRRRTPEPLEDAA